MMMTVVPRTARADDVDPTELSPLDLENTLHDLVYAGSLALAAAQHAIPSNWYAAYVRYVGV